MNIQKMIEEAKEENKKNEIKRIARSDMAMKDFMKDIEKELEKIKNWKLSPLTIPSFNPERI